MRVRKSRRIAALWLLMLGSGPVAGAPLTDRRSVELLSFATASDEPLDGKGGPRASDVRDGADFTLTALPRRRFAGPSRQAGLQIAALLTRSDDREARRSLGYAVDDEVIATASAIAIPAWMRPGAAYPPLVSVPPWSACTPARYRPSGLLRLAAEARRRAFFDLVRRIACDTGVPVGLLDALVIAESGYNPAIVSPKQAVGLTQLMAGTARALGVDRFDATDNIRGGARYLREQLDRYGRVALALAAYNAGPGRIRNGNMPAIAETRNYIARVLANWAHLAAQPAAPEPDRTRTVAINGF